MHTLHSDAGAPVLGQTSRGHESSEAVRRGCVAVPLPWGFLAPGAGAAARRLRDFVRGLPAISRWGVLLAVSAVVPACTGDAPESMPFDAVADGRQLMVSVIEPAAEAYWDAVGVVMDLDGTHEIEPQGDEEWEAVENAAWVLAESGNLLLMEDRAQGREHWIAMSRAMIEVGRRAVDAAVARDPEAVFDVGAEVYFVCVGCHAAYATQTIRPSDTPDSVDADSAGEDVGARGQAPPGDQGPLGAQVPAGDQGPPGVQVPSGDQAPPGVP